MDYSAHTAYTEPASYDYNRAPAASSPNHARGGPTPLPGDPGGSGAGRPCSEPGGNGAPVGSAFSLPIFRLLSARAREHSCIGVEIAPALHDRSRGDPPHDA